MNGQDPNKDVYPKKSLWQQTYDDFECQHQSVEARRRVVSGGSLHIVKQCLTCGRSLGAVSKKDYTVEAIKVMALFDDSLHEKYHSHVADEYAKRSEYQRTLNREEFFEWYNEYLQSPEWKEKRRLVLERDKYICQGCGKRRATQAHHLTYERAGKEMLFDLVAVCENCHEAIHMEKNNG